MNKRTNVSAWESYIDQFFGYQFNSGGCDIFENDNEIRIILDLPGVKRENIKMAFNDSGLSIKFKREAESNETKWKYATRSRWSGVDQFNINVPRDEVDAANIVAELANGVLYITLFKIKETKNSINVKWVNA